MAAFATEFIREYRASGTPVPVAFPAFSPGHQEDDFLTAARFFVDIVPLYDELHLHNYWTPEAGSHLSEWWGRRYTRQIAAYQYAGPVAITEFNREFNTNDGADVTRLVTEISEWEAALPPQIRYALWFIASSPDPAFNRLEINNNRTLVAGFARRSQEPTVDTQYTDVNISLVGSTPFVPGQPARVTFKVIGHDALVPGPGIATLQVDFPHGYDEWAYAGQTNFVWAEAGGGQPDSDGVFEFYGNVPAFDFQDGAQAVFTIFYMARKADGSIATGRRNDFSLPLSRTGGVAVPPPVAPPAPVTVPAGSYIADRHYLFRRLGDMHNKFAEAQAIAEELQAHLVGASDPK